MNSEFSKAVVRKGLLCAAAALFASGCTPGLKGDRITRELSAEVQRSDRQSAESRTLSRLAAMERSLNDFIQAEGRIPKRIEELMPKYLADIPEAELGLRGHKDAAAVTFYGPEIISEGRINGAKLQDSGGWGYVYNDRQVILFVDCVHKMMSGKLWYEARGVY